MNFPEDNYRFWNDSHEENIINLTRQTVTIPQGWYFLTQDVYTSFIPSRCGYCLIDSHSQNKIGKADPEGSAILLRFQNVADLLKYIIDSYDRLGSSVQYETQQLLLESNGISEEEKRRVVNVQLF